MREAKYTIGVVADMLNITPQTIRVYEERGFIQPTRTAGNIRLYSDDDVDILQMILKLTQDLKVNLAGVEIIIKLVRQIHALEYERDQLYHMLFEAGEMLQSVLDSSKESNVPMRSSIGTLIQIMMRS
ncbi:MerR family transcriptional regulator [bacterium]|nr:MerR family transcriptional regulator [candidate division CSSED10-310 bacterium]